MSSWIESSKSSLANQNLGNHGTLTSPVTATSLEPESKSRFLLGSLSGHPHGSFCLPASFHGCCGDLHALGLCLSDSGALGRTDITFQSPSSIPGVATRANDRSVLLYIFFDGFAPTCSIRASCRTRRICLSVRWARCVRSARCTPRRRSVLIVRGAGRTRRTWLSVRGVTYTRGISKSSLIQGSPWT